MHLNRCVPKILLALTLLLSGCSAAHRDAESQLKALRSRWQESAGISARAALTADYGERVYEYTVAVEGNAQAGTMTVEEPENIAGAVLQWSDGTTSLTCEDTTLETGALDESGLSPADAVPVLFASCQTGRALECAWEDDLLYVLLEHPSRHELTAAYWLEPETGALHRWELAENGRTVLTMSFTECTLLPPSEAAQ